MTFLNSKRVVGTSLDEPAEIIPINFALPLDELNSFFNWTELTKTHSNNFELNFLQNQLSLSQTS